MENKKVLYAFRQMVDGVLETYTASSLEELRTKMLQFLGEFGVYPVDDTIDVWEIASIYNYYFNEDVEIILP